LAEHRFKMQRDYLRYRRKNTHIGTCTHLGEGFLSWVFWIFTINGGAGQDNREHCSKSCVPKHIE